MSRIRGPTLFIALVIVNSSKQDTVVAPLPSLTEPTTTTPTPTTTPRPTIPVFPLPTLPSTPPTTSPTGRPRRRRSPP